MVTADSIIQMRKPTITSYISPIESGGKKTVREIGDIPQKKVNVPQDVVYQRKNVIRLPGVPGIVPPARTPSRPGDRGGRGGTGGGGGGGRGGGVILSPTLPPSQAPPIPIEPPTLPPSQPPTPTTPIDIISPGRRDALERQEQQRQDNIRRAAIRNAENAARRIKEGLISSSKNPFGAGITIEGFDKPITKENVGELTNVITQLKGQGTQVETPQQTVEATIYSTSQGEIRYKDTTGVDRLATRDEYNYYKSQTSTLSARAFTPTEYKYLKPLIVAEQFFESKARTAIGKVSEFGKNFADTPAIIYAKENVGKAFTSKASPLNIIYESYAKPYELQKKVFPFVEEKIIAKYTGKTIPQHIEYLSAKEIALEEKAFKKLNLPSYVETGIKNLRKPFGYDIGFGLGITKEGIESFEKNPVGDIAIPVALGAGLGAGIGLSKELYSTTFRQTLQEAGMIGAKTLKDTKLRKAFKVGATALITGVFTYEPAKEIAFSKSSLEQGEVFGRTGREFALFGAGALAAEKFIAEPIITKDIKGAVIQTKGLSYGIPVETPEGKLRLKSQYFIEQVALPRQIELSTRFRNFVNAEPIRELSPIGKTRTYTAITPFPTFVGDEFVLIETSPRGRRISLVTGETNIISTDIYPKRVIPIDKALFEELAGVGRLEPNKFYYKDGFKSIRKRDIEPSMEKFVPKLFSKDDILLQGDIEAALYYKGARNADINLLELKKGFPQEGKRITSARYITQLKETQYYKGVKLPEDFPALVFKETVSFKDTTMPMARASGKFGKLKFDTLIKKEPIKIGETKRGGIDLDRIDFKQNDLKANLPEDFSIQSERQFQRQEQQLQKGLSREQILELAKQRKAPVVTQKIYPQKISAALKLDLITSPLVISKPTPLIKEIETKSAQRTFQTERSLQLDLQIERTSGRQIERQLTKQIDKQIEKSMEKQIDKTLSRQLERQMQKQMQKQQQKQIQKQINKITEFPRTEFPSIKVPRITSGKPRISGAKKRRSIKIGKAFDVFVIEKGKPKIIRRGVSRIAALDIGAEEITRGLKATFGIKESTMPLLDIGTRRTFTKYRSLFREPAMKSPYKKYGEVFVQKKTRVGRLGGRLAFPGEKREIQRARMNKALNLIR